VCVLVSCFANHILIRSHFLDTAIFRGALARSAELEQEADELRRELKVWKAAYTATEDEHKETKRTVAKLERNIDSLKVRAPLYWTCKSAISRK
jgi:septal ring factor EnvC (AmiA/AmiB activator)